MERNSKNDKSDPVLTVAALFTFSVILGGFIWSFAPNPLPMDICDTALSIDRTTAYRKDECRQVYAECNGEEICVEGRLFHKYTGHIQRLILVHDSFFNSGR